VSSSHLFSPLVFSSTLGFLLSLFLLLFLCSFSFFPLFFFVLSFLFFLTFAYMKKHWVNHVLGGFGRLFCLFAPRLFLRREVRCKDRTKKTSQSTLREGEKGKKTGKEGKKTKEAASFLRLCLFFSSYFSCFFFFFLSSPLWIPIWCRRGVSFSSLPSFVPTCAFFVLFLFFLKIGATQKRGQRGKKEYVKKERRKHVLLPTFGFLKVKENKQKNAFDSFVFFAS